MLNQQKKCIQNNNGMLGKEKSLKMIIKGILIQSHISANLILQILKLLYFLNYTKAQCNGFDQCLDTEGTKAFFSVILKKN